MRIQMVDGITSVFLLCTNICSFFLHAQPTPNMIDPDDSLELEEILQDCGLHAALLHTLSRHRLQDHLAMVHNSVVQTTGLWPCQSIRAEKGATVFFGIVETAERAETIGSSVKPNGDESTACRKHRRNISSAPPTDQYHRRALRTAYHRTTSTTSASATVPWFYSLHKPWSRPPTFGVHIIRG